VCSSASSAVLQILQIITGHLEYLLDEFLVVFFAVLGVLPVLNDVGT